MAGPTEDPRDRNIAGFTVEFRPQLQALPRVGHSDLVTLTRSVDVAGWPGRLFSDTDGYGVERLEWNDFAGYHVIDAERTYDPAGPAGPSLGEVVRMGRSLYGPTTTADEPFDTITRVDAGRDAQILATFADPIVTNGCDDAAFGDVKGVHAPRNCTDYDITRSLHRGGDHRSVYERERVDVYARPAEARYQYAAMLRYMRQYAGTTVDRPVPHLPQSNLIVTNNDQQAQVTLVVDNIVVVVNQSAATQRFGSDPTGVVTGLARRIYRSLSTGGRR